MAKNNQNIKTTALIRLNLKFSIINLIFGLMQRDKQLAISFGLIKRKVRKRDMFVSRKHYIKRDPTPKSHCSN